MTWKQKYEEKRIETAREIIASIDHWLRLWKDNQIDQRVGALIQRYAMRELAFVDYIKDDFESMDTLRTMANEELVRYNQPAVPKPIWLPPAPRLLDPYSFTTSKVTLGGLKARADALPPIEIKTFFHKQRDILKAPKSRRQELEEMSALDVKKAYDKARVKERKKERIEYILKSEEAE